MLLPPTTRYLVDTVFAVELLLVKLLLLEYELVLDLLDEDYDDFDELDLLDDDDEDFDVLLLLVALPLLVDTVLAVELLLVELLLLEYELELDLLDDDELLLLEDFDELNLLDDDD